MLLPACGQLPDLEAGIHKNTNIFSQAKSIPGRYRIICLHLWKGRKPDPRSLRALYDYRNIENLLERFGPISLPDMDRVSLMDRVDTKFVFHIDDLPGILLEALPHYQVLEISQKRLFNYHSLYYDTPEFRMYHDHHRGKRNRHKVRYRKYVETNQVFLEVKFKSNTNRTNKKRIPRTEVEMQPSEESWKFIRKRLKWADHRLEPKLWTLFRRFTLVHLDHPERITIDIGLELKNDRQAFSSPFMVIAEVKREAGSQRSDFMSLLLERGIKPSGMSKYCLGCVLLYPGVKTNLYKRKLLILSKLSKDERTHPLAASPATVRD